MSAFVRALRPGTLIVSLMYANNEPTLVLGSQDARPKGTGVLYIRDGYACAEVALERFEHGTGFAYMLADAEVRSILRDSLHYNRKACTPGSAMGCKNLGFSLTDERFGKPQSKKTLRAYARACELGFQRLPGPMEEPEQVGCDEAKELQQELEAKQLNGNNEAGEVPKRKEKSWDANGKEQPRVDDWSHS